MPPRGRFKQSSGFVVSLASPSPVLLEIHIMQPAAHPPASWRLRIDGRCTSLRGFAALAVMMAHYQFIGLLPAVPLFKYSAQIPLMIFFFLSSFLLSHSLSSDPNWLARPGLAVSAYAVNRIFRIFPLFLLIVGATDWARIAYFPQSTSYWEAFRSSLTLGRAPSVLWTIPVELTFYIYLPFVLRMVSWTTRSPLGAASLSAGFAIWCVAIAAARSFDVSRSVWMTLGFHHYANSFVGGVLLYALLHNGHVGFPGSGRRIAQIAPLILILAYPIFFYSIVRQDYFMTELKTPAAWRSYYDHIFPFAPIVIGGVVYGLLHPVATAFSRAMQTPLLRRIGQWSFGVYLIHIPTVVLIRSKLGAGQIQFIISIAATFAFAAMLSKYVERPAIALGRAIGRAAFDRFAPKPAVRPLESMGA